MRQLAFQPSSGLDNLADLRRQITQMAAAPVDLQIFNANSVGQLSCRDAKTLKLGPTAKKYLFLLYSNLRRKTEYFARRLLNKRKLWLLGLSELLMFSFLPYLLALGSSRPHSRILGSQDPRSRLFFRQNSERKKFKIRKIPLKFVEKVLKCSKKIPENSEKN